MPPKSKKIYTGSYDLRNRRETVYTSPRLRVSFEMDRRGIAKVAVGQPLKDATRSAVVQRAMPYAIQNSPTGDTLEYISSWRASDGYTVIAGLRRAACKLINVAPHAAAVEWGRGGRAGVLRKTLAHLNSTSPLGIERAARKARAKERWNPDLHPRGPKGRFAPIRRFTAEELRARAQRAQRAQTAADRGPRTQEEWAKFHEDFTREKNRILDDARRRRRPRD